MPAKPKLGDDVLAKPRKGDDANLVVCRSEVVAGKVRLKVEAPATLRASPGAQLLVKHVYRLQEDSGEKEEYRILLRSSLDGHEHAPSLKRFGDNYAVTDDYSGYVLHEHKLPLKGPCVLEFEVGCEYTVGSWKSETVDVHDAKSGRGKVTIQLG